MRVTFFGHRDVSNEKESILRSTLIELIENHNANLFYVGNNGNFDSMVYRQLKNLSQKYNIEYIVVLPYLSDKDINQTDTLFPEGLEFVPPRFAISWRNKWMIQHSDTIVSCTTRDYGGAWQFTELARKQGKKIIKI